MTVSKLTNPPSQKGVIDKVNEIIDELGNVSVATDNSTITKNSSDQLQTVAVKDNRSGNAIKTWTGTRQQYDAIVSKDANTLYNITDDTDVTLSLLNLLYPVGSLYIASGTLSTCPLAVLGVGTWQLKSSTTLITSVNNTAPVVGNGTTLGWTDGKGGNYGTTASDYSFSPRTAGYGAAVGTDRSGSQVNPNYWLGITTDASKSGIEANITSTSMSVTIWERTA